MYQRKLDDNQRDLELQHQAEQKSTFTKDEWRNKCIKALSMGQGTSPFTDFHIGHQLIEEIDANRGN